MPALWKIPSLYGLYRAEGKQFLYIVMVSVFYCLFFAFPVPAEGASCVFRFAPPLKHNVCVILGENGASGEAGCENGT